MWGTFFAKKIGFQLSCGSSQQLNISHIAIIHLLCDNICIIAVKTHYNKPCAEFLALPKRITNRNCGNLVVIIGSSGPQENQKEFCHYCKYQWVFIRFYNFICLDTLKMFFFPCTMAWKMRNFVRKLGSLRKSELYPHKMFITTVASSLVCFHFPQSWEGPFSGGSAVSHPSLPRSVGPHNTLSIKDEMETA